MRREFWIELPSAGAYRLAAPRAIPCFLPVQRPKDESDVTGLVSFDNSTCKRVSRVFLISYLMNHNIHNQHNLAYINKSDNQLKLNGDFYSAS